MLSGLSSNLIVSAVLGALFGFLSSALLTEYRFWRRDRRKHRAEVEEWLNNCESTLHQAHRLLVDRKYLQEIPTGFTDSPSKLVSISDNPELQQLDELIAEIESLASSAPDEYSGRNITYFMEEASRHYRWEEPPDDDFSHRSRWRWVRESVKNALDEVREEK